MSELLAETEAIAGSIGLRLDVSPGVKRIDQLLRELGALSGDLRTPFRDIAERVITPAIASAFSSKQSPEGEAWPEDAPETLRKKGGGTTLVDSGSLRASLLGEADGSLRTFGKKRAVIGTTLGYALPTQWGYGEKSRASMSSAAKRAESGLLSRSGGRRSAVPARSFVGWNSRMQEQAAEVVIENLQEMVDAAAARANGGGE